MIKCKLLCHSTSSHLEQLYTGFVMLHKSGVIELTQQIVQDEIRFQSDATHLRDAGHAHLRAIVDDNIRLHFDTHDSVEIATEELQKCDFYFKRSCSPQFISTLPKSQQRKIFPLGLNYRVLPNTLDRHALQRHLLMRQSLREKMSGLRWATDTRNFFGFLPRLKLMEALPSFNATPKVLFLAATYDPYDDPLREKEKIEDRVQLNETRARCIKLLKDEFGPRFRGGFSYSKFAADNYPKLVVPKADTVQKNYLEILREYPICIATTGLHGSIGWKLAEYVATSKAIVSEQLRYKVPGELENGKNYLKFTSPEQCVAESIKLVVNADLRRTLMANNASYYRSYLRPDSLILNAVLTALKHKSSQTVELIRTSLSAQNTNSTMKFHE